MLPLSLVKMYWLYGKFFLCTKHNHMNNNVYNERYTKNNSDPFCHRLAFIFHLLRDSIPLQNRHGAITKRIISRHCLGMRNFFEVVIIVFRTHSVYTLEGIAIFVYQSLTVLSCFCPLFFE